MNNNIIRSHLRSCASCETASSDADDRTVKIEVNGRSWCKQDAKHTMKDYNVIYIGTESRTLTNLMMVMNTSKFYSYNPSTCTARLETIQVNKALMKRFYLIEKAKDANIIGIVVGTLSVANYLSIHNRLKDLIKKAGMFVTRISLLLYTNGVLGSRSGPFAFPTSKILVLIEASNNTYKQ